MLVDTPICDFGWKAPGFTLRDAYGISHNFDDLMVNNGLLVAFICNHCPYVVAIIDRLVDDAATLQEMGINVVGIMANDYTTHEKDSPENMKLFAKKNAVTFPYLIDETQDVARAYGAVCTPDFFGLDAKGELQYRGRIDDAKMDNAASRTAELLAAMELMVKTGSGPQHQVPSMGCSIKWRA